MQCIRIIFSERTFAAKKTKTKPKKKTKTKNEKEYYIFGRQSIFTEMTKTKNEKDPTCAIFSESRGCKDIKYDLLTKKFPRYFHDVFKILSRYFYDV